MNLKRTSTNTKMEQRRQKKKRERERDERNKTTQDMKEELKKAKGNLRKKNQTEILEIKSL
jgi:hypothetical protein